MYLKIFSDEDEAPDSDIRKGYLLIQQVVAVEFGWEDGLPFASYTLEGQTLDEAPTINLDGNAYVFSDDGELLDGFVIDSLPDEQADVGNLHVERFGDTVVLSNRLLSHNTD